MERKMDAMIEDVKLYTNNRYLLDETKKCYKMTELTETPEGIPDLIVVTATLDEKDAAEVKLSKVVDHFPVVLKYNGTLQTQSLTRKSRLWRTRFIKFLKHYGIVEYIKDYDILQNLNRWVGKKVKVLISEKGGKIYLPHQPLKITRSRD